jgi:hypothetical protein
VCREKCGASITIEADGIVTRINGVELDRPTPQMIIESHVGHVALDDLQIKTNQAKVNMKKRAYAGETVGHIHQEAQSEFVRNAVESR